MKRYIDYEFMIHHFQVCWFYSRSLHEMDQPWVSWCTIGLSFLIWNPSFLLMFSHIDSFNFLFISYEIWNHLDINNMTWIVKKMITISLEDYNYWFLCLMIFLLVCVLLFVWYLLLSSPCACLLSSQTKVYWKTELFGYSFYALS